MTNKQNSQKYIVWRQINPKQCWANPKTIKTRTKLNTIYRNITKSRNQQGKIPNIWDQKKKKITRYTMRWENRTRNSKEIPIAKTKTRNRHDGKQGHKNIYYKYTIYAQESKGKYDHDKKKKRCKSYLNSFKR